MYKQIDQSCQVTGSMLHQRFSPDCIESQPKKLGFLLGKRIKVNADMYKEKWCKCLGRKREAIALKGENVRLQTQDWLHNTHDRGIDQNYC